MKKIYSKCCLLLGAYCILSFAQIPDWITESNQAGAYYGICVSTAGDVNGDGFSDVIVGAYRYQNGQEEEGRAYVYHGSTNGLDTIPDWIAESNQANANFGVSVSSAGDVNGDGFSDVIIGAYHYTNDQLNEGRVFVYHGSDSGLSNAPDWIAEADEAHASFGLSVANAGDVNGDGYSDVIIGAPFYGSMDEGRAVVYYGDSSGLSPTPDWSYMTSQTSSRFGNWVACAGDVNNDGFSDIMVSAYYYDSGQNDEGRVFVFYGDSSGVSTTPDWYAESDQAGARFGISASCAGDVNDDGFSDVIIGARHFDNGEPDEGMAFVYHGSNTGLSLMPDWTAESNQPEAFFGRSVSSAGDVNNDGYSDVIIGAQTFDNGEIDEGRAYVYLGGVNGLDTVPTWTAESNQASSYFSRCVSTAGDVNGDNFSDAIIGAYYYDNGELNEGRTYAFYGNLTTVQENLIKKSKKRIYIMPTIFSGTLLLPKGESCKVLDITGRVVVPNKIKPGIYFIEVDGVVTQKVIKIK